MWPPSPQRRGGPRPSSQCVAKGAGFGAECASIEDTALYYYSYYSYSLYAYSYSYSPTT
jgi:hypothetical protein